MKSIYLAVPYSHKNLVIQNQRFATCNQVAAKLMERGNIVFSPISHSDPIDAYVKNGDHAFWLNQDKWFLDRVDELYVLCLEGWDKSYGVDWEMKYMKAQNKPVTFIDEECNEIYPC
jgi:nucleoside 2-deoxyribosyltransferase